MNTIAPAIKRRRVQLGLTQKEMAEKIHLSEKAWQNIENGATRLDIERLQQIAEVLEMSLTDLINNDALVQNNTFDNSSVQQVAYANEVKLQSITDPERELYKQMLADKDEQIRLLREEVIGLKEQVNGLVEKVMKG